MAPALSTAKAADMDIALDICGQQPGLQIHTQICSCYRMDDTSPGAQEAVVSKLRAGLSRLGASFPWTAGRVVNTGAGDGDSGTFSIRPLDAAPRLVVKDLTGDPSAPTMALLRESSFAMRLLDEGTVCAVNTLPGGTNKPSPETAEERAAVFIVQATFLVGGLILAFNGQHQTMDMTGQGHVIALLDKACRGEAFTAEELAAGNLERAGLVPLLNDDDDQRSEGSDALHQELARQLAQPDGTALDPTALPPQQPACSWVEMDFAGAALAAMKAEATGTLPSGAGDPGFVSTDDVLTAFVWQAATRSRLHRLGATRGSGEVKLTRAIDVRGILGVPPLYAGLMQDVQVHTYADAAALAGAPAGEVASRLRAGLAPGPIARHVRALATLLARTRDRAAVGFVAGLDPARDLMLSSWAKVYACYALHFGLGLGPPERVARPRFAPVESLAYILPRRPDDDGGAVTVAICLRDEDLDALRRDPELARFGRLVE